MDNGTAVWVLVGLAALLTFGILFFLFRAIKVLARLEESTRRLEENALPLLLSIRRITDEVEPLVRKTSERYQQLDESLSGFSRSPVFSLLSPILNLGSPFRSLGGFMKIARGTIAGIARAREVLRQSHAGKRVLLTDNETPQKETSHGQ
jgi:hypothetical protein